MESVPFICLFFCFSFSGRHVSGSPRLCWSLPLFASGFAPASDTALDLASVCRRPLSTHGASSPINVYSCWILVHNFCRFSFFLPDFFDFFFFFVITFCLVGRLNVAPMQIPSSSYFRPPRLTHRELAHLGEPALADHSDAPSRDPKGALNETLRFALGRLQCNRHIRGFSFFFNKCNVDYKHPSVGVVLRCCCSCLFIFFFFFFSSLGWLVAAWLRTGSSLTSAVFVSVPLMITAKGLISSVYLLNFMFGITFAQLS